MPGIEELNAAAARISAVNIDDDGPRVEGEDYDEFYIPVQRMNDLRLLARECVARLAAEKVRNADDEPAPGVESGFSLISMALHGIARKIAWVEQRLRDAEARAAKYVVQRDEAREAYQNLRNAAVMETGSHSLDALIERFPDRPDWRKGGE